MRILLDSDDVIVTHIPEVIKRFNEKYSRNVKVEDIKTWELEDSIEDGYLVNAFFKEKGLYANLEIKPHAKEVINKWLSEGHEIVIVSAAHREAIEDKFYFYDTFFPEIPKENVLFLSRKDLIKGDIFVDDGIHNLDSSNVKHRIVFSQPWNESNETYLRVKDWFELEKEVDKIISSQNLENVFCNLGMSNAIHELKNLEKSNQK